MLIISEKCNYLYNKVQREEIVKWKGEKLEQLAVAQKFRKIKVLHYTVWRVDPCSMAPVVCVVRELELTSWYTLS